MIKRIGLALAATALAATGLMAVSATPAAADTPGCVDSWEWRHFSVGDTKGYVENLFDTRGWTAWASGSYWVKKYWACGVVYDKVKVKYVWTGRHWAVRAAWRY